MKYRYTHDEDTSWHETESRTLSGAKGQASRYYMDYYSGNLYIQARSDYTSPRVVSIKVDGQWIDQ